MLFSTTTVCYSNLSIHPFIHFWVCRLFVTHQLSHILCVLITNQTINTAWVSSSGIDMSHYFLHLICTAPAFPKYALSCMQYAFYLTYYFFIHCVLNFGPHTHTSVAVCSATLIGEKIKHVIWNAVTEL